MNQSDKASYQFGEFRLEPSEHLLRHNGELVSLTPKAFETLIVLVQKNGQLVTKDELLKEVWGDVFVEESNLARNIWTLRKALGDEKGDHRFIETVPKLGYRFIAPISRIPQDESVDVVVQRRVRARIVEEEHETDTNLTALTAPVTSLPAPTQANRFRHTAIRVGAAIGGMIVLSMGLFFVSRSSRRTVAAEPIKSIAVMPFSNAGNAELDYLSDGVTEDIIRRLSHASNLKIIARSSVYRFRGKQIDPQAVGRELNVQGVLTGQVVQRGDSLLITSELVDVRDGSRLWGDRYERKASEVQLLQSELAQDVLNTLHLQLAGDNQSLVERNYTHNPDAYQLYLKGRYFWNKRTRDGMRKGLDFFEQAISVDPNYSLAYSGIADCYNVLSQFGDIAPNTAMPNAKAAALMALKIDDTLSEAHASLGTIYEVYDWNWSAAEAEFKRAIDLNPNNATAHHWYAMYLSAIGKQDEALAQIRLAKELDPVSLIINTNEGWILFCAHDYDRAIQQLHATIEMDPDFSNAHYKLALVYEIKGMYKEAVDEYLKNHMLAGVKQEKLEALKSAYVKSGWKGYCQAELDMLRSDSKTGYVLPKYFALSYLQLHETEEAFKWFEEAFKERAELLVYLKVDPRFDPIRSDPRFQDLLRRVNLG
ncbi:MAG: hypothetical protein C5B55_01110 [Blastocatellia bacterium]|nr:MAG: hypothetical protein C5B55_01110 [Blastocatellia bacterium]